MLSAAAKKISDHAKQKNMWIFDPTYKKWYSPEDFAHIFHFANAPENWIAQLQIRHPSEGIQAGFKHLNDIHTKLQGLIVTVMAYYKKKTDREF